MVGGPAMVGRPGGQQKMAPPPAARAPFFVGPLAGPPWPNHPPYYCWAYYWVYYWTYYWTYYLNPVYLNPVYQCSSDAPG